MNTRQSIRSDWHIHSHCSCDSACLTFEDLISDAKALSLTDFGITDHYHTRIQEPDIAASRAEYDAALVRHPELAGHFHFGIEATLVSEWEVGKIASGEYTELPVYGLRTGGPAHSPVLLDFDDEFLARYGIEYVVTGMHWSMYCATDTQTMAKEYHRQYMYAATHPFTTIMAHYLWWDASLLREVPNPFTVFDVVSESMRSELKAALLECHTAFELNPCMICTDALPESFHDAYLGWAAELQRSGVVLSMGSDCHNAHLRTDYFAKMNQRLAHYGIDRAKLFCL